MEYRYGQMKIILVKNEMKNEKMKKRSTTQVLKTLKTQKLTISITKKILFIQYLFPRG